MKKKALLISSLFIAFSMSMLAQYDDIYYNPRKANETRITTSNEETVVISNNVRDVDTYNRQAPANRPNQTSNVEQDDFEYTKRITRFHNPEAVTINNPEYVYIYNDTPSEPNPTINIRVTLRWNPWDYSYFTRYYYPSYHWSWDSNYGWGYTYNTYYPFYSTYPSSFYYGYYPPGYGYYGYGYYGYPSYYHHRPTYTTRKGYNNYDRTPNYVNDGRGSSSSYGYQNSGQRSTRSVGTNPTNTNASSTRNTSTYNNRERTFNSAPSSSTQNTRKSDVTTNTSTPRETSSGRGFNSSSSSFNSNNSGTRSTQSSDNSSSSNGGSRSNGGRSFSR